MYEEKIKKIMEEIKPEVDFTDAQGIITDKLINSIEMVALISKLESAFDIEIDMEYMDAEHFDSLEKISEMLEELI